MQQIFKPIKYFVFFIFIAGASPFILAKLGFWETSFASTPKFKDAFPKTELVGSVRSYASAVERAGTAVVSISSKKEMTPQDMHPMMRDPFFRQFFGDPRGGYGNPSPEMVPSIGSGVIVTSDGYILTNNHVVRDADEIEVKLSDGRTSKAVIVGTDPDSDVAVLKVDMKDLPVIALGDSDQLHVGDVVLAIGSPFGMAQTVTQGIISAKQRNDLGINTYENFIQTDAAINPGNSGGALINPDGNLIGINNAIYTRNGGYMGIGFAIPVNLAKEVMTQIISNGHVTRGWLGITVRPLNPEIRESLSYADGEGAVIAGIIRNGPAHKAGLQSGDVIVNLNNEKVKTSQDVLAITSKLKPEKSYEVSVFRGGQIYDHKVVVGTRPNPDTKKKKEEKPPKG